MNNPSDYRAIAIWGKVCASFDYYIRDEQYRAAADNAPYDAIFKSVGGDWVTVDEIKNTELKEEIKAKLAKA
jgi:hypothetical protein